MICAHLVFAQAAFASEARNLEFRSRWRDIGIQSGCRRGHQVDGNRLSGIFRLQARDVALHAVNQLAVRGPEVGARRSWRRRIRSLPPTDASAGSRDR